jgi:hypothetical protein
MLKEKEQRIIEQRTIEATRKLYMGKSGKIALIARYLGQPIIRQDEGGGMYNVTYMEDFSKNELDISDQSPEAMQRRLPYAEEYAEEYSKGTPRTEPTGYGWRESRNYSVPIITPNVIGWLFDGLSRGMHLEIKTDRKARDILVSWKGRMVYKEEGGDLKCYVPSSEWEDKIDILSQQVELKTRKMRKTQRIEDQESEQEEKKGWLQAMKEVWGL